MTFVGKLLVILQLVMSLCFMALAGSVYTNTNNYKTQLAAAQVQINDRDKENTRIREEYQKRLDDKEEERKQQEDAATRARNDLTLATDELEQLKTEFATLQTEFNTQSSLANIAGDEARIRREETLIQRRINEQLNENLNGLNASAQQLQDELFNNEVELAELKERYDEMLNTTGVYRRVLAANGFSTDPKNYNSTGDAVPVVFGKVIDTKRSTGVGRELVEVSIGSDDGLRAGNVLYVYRTGDRNQFLGEIRLELVTPDKSVGVVINRAKNGVIEREDYVATKL